MLKKVSHRTLELIKEKALAELNLNKKLTINDVNRLFDYFTNVEGALANAESYGEKINQQVLDEVTHAVDDLIITADESVDLDDLNKRLGF